MGNLEEHARRELKAAGLFDEDSDYGGMLGEAVMKLVAKFSEQGHSGFSASMCLDVFDKVARYQPLGPLTGADDEWNHVTDDLWQNNRCSRVFKRADGSAYDIEGRVFRDSDGCCYTGSDSRVDVTFPYSPATEYVDAPVEDGE